MDVGDGTLGDEGVEALASCLRCPTLEALELEAKGVGDAGLAAIAKGVAAAPALDALVLGRNAFGDVSTLADALAARGRRLGFLDVSENANLVGAAKLAPFATRLRCGGLAPGAFDPRGLAGLEGLAALDVSGCGLDAEAVAARARAVTTVPSRCIFFVHSVLESCRNFK